MRRALNGFVAVLIGLSVLGCGKKTADADKKDETRLAETDPKPDSKPEWKETEEEKEKRQEREKQKEVERQKDIERQKEIERQKQLEKEKNPQPPPAEKGIRIVFVPAGTGADYWKAMRGGAERAAAELGEEGLKIQLVWEAPKNEYDSREQIEQLDRLAMSTAKGLIVVPTDVAATTDALKRVSQKMPLVLVDRRVESPKTDEDKERVLACISSDYTSGGTMAAEKLLAALAAEGKTEPRLAVLRFAPTAEGSEQRVEAFLEGIKDAQKKGSKATIVSSDVYLGPDGRAKAMDFVTKFGDQIDGLFVPAEPLARDVLAALKARNLTKIVVGAEASEEMLRAVRAGELRGVVLPNPDWIGYTAVWALAKHIDGYDIRSAVLFYTVIPEVYIDKSNVDTEGKALLAPDPNTPSIRMPDLKKRLK